MLMKPHWPTDAFEQWWKLYRIKRDKPHAEKMFKKAHKENPDLLFDDLVYATKCYMAEYDRPEDPKKFRPPMKHGGTFMNKGGWSEYLERPESPDTSKVLIKRGSPQAAAWERHRGRGFPWGSSGVWAVDSEYPPMLDPHRSEAE